MNARQWWKMYYRLLRVTKRETHKATMDLILYGTGAVFVPKNGDDPYHVPIEKLRLNE